MPKIIQATAPREYTQHARNPQNNVQMGGDNTVLSPVYCSPFVYDIENGRRYATLKDFENLTKIHQMISHLHHAGGIVCEPVDTPVNKRHLDMMLNHITYGDGGLFGALIGSERAEDSVAMMSEFTITHLSKDIFCLNSATVFLRQDEDLLRIRSQGRQFIGRDGLLSSKQTDDHWSMYLLELEDAEFDPFYMYTVFRDDEAVGMITSGAYGYSINRAIGLAYFRCRVNFNEQLQVLVLDRKVPARIRPVN